jgi:hypothetical protein
MELVLFTQLQGRKKKKTGWLHSKGILKSPPLYILKYIQTYSNIFKYSMEKQVKEGGGKPNRLLRFGSFIWGKW